MYEIETNLSLKSIYFLSKTFLGAVIRYLSTETTLPLISDIGTVTLFEEIPPFRKTPTFDHGILGVSGN